MTPINLQYYMIIYLKKKYTKAKIFTTDCTLNRRKMVLVVVFDKFCTS